MAFFGWTMHLMAKSAWSAMAADSAQFVEAIQPRPVAAERVLAWHEKLVAAPGVMFLERFTAEMPRGFVVCLEDSDETTITQTLGDDWGLDEDGEQLAGKRVEESCTLWVIADQESVGRALATALRTRLIAAEGYLTSQGGYDECRYLGATSPTFDERLTRGWLGVHVTGLRYSASSTVRMRDYSFTIDDGTPIVLPHDATAPPPADVQGQVRAAVVE